MTAELEAFICHARTWRKLHEKSTTDVRELAVLMPAACEAADGADAHISVQHISSLTPQVLPAERCIQRLHQTCCYFRSTLDAMETLHHTIMQRAALGGAAQVRCAAEQCTANCDYGATFADLAQWLAVRIQMFQDDLDLKKSILEDVKLHNTAGTLQALAVAWAAQPDIDEEHEAELAARIALAIEGSKLRS